MMEKTGNVQEYDLASGDYLVLGKGRIAVNGKQVENGTVLSEPGQYEIEVSGEGAYRRTVRLYRSGEPAAEADWPKWQGEGAVQWRRSGPPLAYEKGVMPIGGFYGPYRKTDERRGNQRYDFIREDIYEKLRDAGINLMLYNDSDYSTEAGRKDVLDDLEMASKYHIGVYVHDGRIGTDTEEGQLKEFLADFARYEAFRGIALVDEPYAPYYDGVYPRKEDGTMYETYPNKRVDSFGKASSYMNRFTNLNGNINLLPMIRDLGGEDYAEDYDRYLEEYIAYCRPRVLSFDYYVFAGGYASFEGYFANLAMVREKALKYGLSFWNFIQAGSNWNDAVNDLEPTVNDTPSRGQLLWNVNTSLAYGAVGIQYFTAIQPYFFAYETEGKYDYRRNGLIGADGETNSWYDDAKEANAQIAAVDEVLLEAVSRCVLAAGEKSRKWTGISRDSDRGAGIGKLSCGNPEEGVIAGVFDYQGHTALYIVNNDMEQAQTAEVSMTEETSCREIMAGLDRVREAASSYQTRLEPGGAVLVLLGE